MRLVLVTAPSVEPVTLEELQTHLRADTSDNADDDLLISIQQAAREHVEHITRRALLTQTWDYSLDAWPDGNAIVLPLGNLQNAVATAPVVTWLDADGTSTTLTWVTDYLVQTAGDQCGVIALPYSGAWPTGTLYPVAPITVRYVAGWTTAALVPASLRAAVKLLAADLYEMRGEPVLGQTVVENKTASRLLAPWRLWTEF